jgi:UDP-GlcNAc3NAcA epimerase
VGSPGVAKHDKAELVSGRLLYTIGTRPEVIRSAAILRELSGLTDVQVEIVNTRQHFDPPMMSDLLAELDLPPASHNLPPLRGSPAVRMGELIQNLAVLMEDHTYDAVAVYGDTDSSLAAAIAAGKQSLPVVHIEAGCRSGDLRMQEELNRRLIDHMSSLLLAVSPYCAQQLARESVPGRVVITGDPQFDVFASIAPQPLDPESRERQAFVTIHRAENVDDPVVLGSILQALELWCELTSTVALFPAHPRTRATLSNSGSEARSLKWIRIVEPMSYRDTMQELSRSVVCITDSGGLQKEAFWLRVPCVTVRPSTEWVETVEAGANALSPDPHLLPSSIAAVTDASRAISWSVNPYGGSGNSRRVADAIADWLKPIGTPSQRPAARK